MDAFDNFLGFIKLGEIPFDQIWIVTTALIIAFIMAFAIGANDVANSFATTVGSKVLTVRQACILASIFETLGAVLLGSKVSDTIRKGIIDPSMYENEPLLLSVGQTASLVGCAVFLLGATFFGMPVSTTHSIVAATVGFSLVVHGFEGIQWMELLWIALSWLISPVSSGLISVVLFFLVKVLILDRKDPFVAGVRLLPIFYAVTVFINVFSTILDPPPLFGLGGLEVWHRLLISIGIALAVAIVIVIIILVIRSRPDFVAKLKAQSNQTESPKANDTLTSIVAMNVPENLKTDQKRPSIPSNKVAPIELTTFSQDGQPNQLLQISTEGKGALQNSRPTENGVINTKPITVEGNNATAVPIPIAIVNENGLAINSEKGTEKDQSNSEGNDSTKVNDKDSKVVDPPSTKPIFSYLQILTGIFGSFAHGGNDVANAIGPLIGIFLLATTCSLATKVPAPIWILLYGGIGITLGLWVWGRRVMMTMGEDLSTVTPSSGFSIEVGAAITVLVASNLGLPISTTHCKVGSVVGVGLFRSRKNVKWSLFGNIVMAWIFTIPFSAAISAAVMAFFLLILEWTGTSVTLSCANNTLTTTAWPSANLTASYLSS